jgi:hypothetical protein
MLRRGLCRVRRINFVRIEAVNRRVRQVLYDATAWLFFDLRAFYFFILTSKRSNLKASKWHLPKDRFLLLLHLSVKGKKAENFGRKNQSLTNRLTDKK